MWAGRPLSLRPWPIGCRTRSRRRELAATTAVDLTNCDTPMTVGDFEDKNKQRWAEYERLVEGIEQGRPGPQAGQLPRRFRELCVDLALAEFRMYGERLTGRLNAQVIRGYEMLYQNRRAGWESLPSLWR